MIICDEQESIYSLNFKIQDLCNLGKEPQQLKTTNGFFIFFFLSRVKL